jgi:hypothetical protein
MIDLDHVLEAAMQTIGEVSGAESAYLIMEQAGDLVIQASYGADAAPLGLRDSARVSEAIVRYT